MLSLLSEFYIAGNLKATAEYDAGNPKDINNQEFAIDFMELNQEEFETLWNIENSWQSNPIKASDETPGDIKKYMKIFLKLDELGLIKIEIRDNQIYGVVATEKGKQILKDKKYEDWIPE